MPLNFYRLLKIITEKNFKTAVRTQSKVLKNFKAMVCTKILSPKNFKAMLGGKNRTPKNFEDIIHGENTVLKNFEGFKTKKTHNCKISKHKQEEY